MKACQLKAIENLLADHTPGNGMLNAFVADSTQALAKLAILKTYIDGGVEGKLLDEIMISYAHVVEWLRDVDVELSAIVV